MRHAIDDEAETKFRAYSGKWPKKRPVQSVSIGRVVGYETIVASHGEGGKCRGDLDFFAEIADFASRTAFM